MDLVKLIALTNAVKLLADNDIEVINRMDKPSEAYVPVQTFLEMFSEYEKTPLQNNTTLFYLTTMYEGILYKTIAYDHELKKGA